MVYVFTGEDAPSKDSQFKKIKQEFLSKETEEFNLDILYAKGLTLKDLQSKLLCLPVGGAKRMVMVKDAQSLKEEIKEFIVRYVKKPYKQIVLVLDFNRQEKKDTFFNSLSGYSKVFRFKEELHPDTFTLNRQISMKRPDFALKILNQLLKEGEKPERIMGGLRYAWENDMAPVIETRRKLKFLLNCDLDIKTGRLKPNFALEKLVINLCRPVKLFHQP